MKTERHAAIFRFYFEDSLGIMMTQDDPGFRSMNHLILFQPLSKLYFDILSIKFIPCANSFGINYLKIYINIHETSHGLSDAT